jgi:hypothetical protein
MLASCAAAAFRDRQPRLAITEVILTLILAGRTAREEFAPRMPARRAFCARNARLESHVFLQDDRLHRTDRTRHGTSHTP